jgi:hypothetical protein
MRDQLANIALGFDKLSPLTGHNGEAVFINASGTGYTSSSVLSLSGSQVNIATLNNTGGATLNASSGVTNIGANAPAFGQLNVQRYAAAPQATISLGDSATPTNDVGIYFRQTSGTAGISTGGAGLSIYRGGPGTTEVVNFGSGGLTTFRHPGSGSTVRIENNTVNAGLVVSSTGFSAGIDIRAETPAKTWRLQVGNSLGQFILRNDTDSRTVLTAFAAGNAEFSAPSSGTTLSVIGLAGATSAISVTDGTVTSGWQADNSSIAHIGTTSNHAFNVMTNAITRVAIAAAGNVTINAPSSGGHTSNAHLIINASGDTALQINATGVGLHAFNANIASACFGSYRIAGTSKGYIGTDGGGIIGSGSGNGFGIRSENDLILMAGTVERVRLTGTAINAPAAGATLNFTDTSSSIQQINSYSSTGFELVTRTAGAGINMYYGAAADIGLGIKSDGRVFGRKLHNVGTVTGTTDQYIASGTYVPTLTGVTNVLSTTQAICQWIRVGNVVTVSGLFLARSSSNALTEVDIALPIASNFTAETNCAGVAQCHDTGGGGLPGPHAPILADNTNDRARVLFVTTQSASEDKYFFTFTYVIA